MKKLLSITAISLLLSGCLNSISLPNSNIQNTMAQDSSLTEKEKNIIHRALAVSWICTQTSSRQQADKWQKASDSLFSESEKIDQAAHIIFVTILPYLHKNQIPATPNNVSRLLDAVRQDKKLSDEVFTVAKEALPAYGFGSDCSSSTLNNVKKTVKNIMATKSR